MSLPLNLLTSIRSICYEIRNYNNESYCRNMYDFCEVIYNKFINLEYHNLYQIDIPIFLFNTVMSDLVKRNNKNELNKDIYIKAPIVIYTGSNYYFNTSQQLLRNIFSIESNYFIKVHYDSKIYYVSKGIICDENFKVIVYTSVSIELAISTKVVNYKIKKYNLFVDENVLISKDKFLKYFKNKLIPYFNDVINGNTEIIIKDLSKVIQTNFNNI